MHGIHNEHFPEYMLSAVKACSDNPPRSGYDRPVVLVMLYRELNSNLVNVHLPMLVLLLGIVYRHLSIALLMFLLSRDILRHFCLIMLTSNVVMHLGQLVNCKGALRMPICII